MNHSSLSAFMTPSGTKAFFSPRMWLEEGLGLGHISPVQALLYPCTYKYLHFIEFQNETVATNYLYFDRSTTSTVYYTNYALTILMISYNATHQKMGVVG